MARIIDAFTQFFDDNGDPLVNGWLKFNVSGTNNTDKDTFADSSLTIKNTNPVQLDGAGRCPNIFGEGSYNVISYTDGGGFPSIQIQQFDPVGGNVDVSQFSEWSASYIYDLGDIAIGSDDKYYRSLISSNQNNDPTISPSQWEEFIFLGVYNQFITYAAGEVVVDSSGYIYRSLADSNINHTPSDSPDWWDVSILQNELLSATVTHNMTSDADYTLTLAENRNGRINITDTGVVLTTTRNIVVSTKERMFSAANNTAQTLTFKTSAGTGIDVVAGLERILICDGTNVIDSGASKVAIAIAQNYPGVPDIQGLDPISRVTVTTAVASVDFTDIQESTYDDYVILFQNVRPSVDDPLFVQIAISGTFQTTGYINDTGASIPGLKLTLPVSSGAGAGTDGIVRIFGANNSVSKPKTINNDMIWDDATTRYPAYNPIGSQYDTATTFDGLRVLFTSANINRGIISLYGVRK